MLFPSLKFQRINTYNHRFPSLRLPSVVLSGSSSLYLVIFLLLCSLNLAFSFDCSYLNHWFFYFCFARQGGGTVSRFQRLTLTALVVVVVWDQKGETKTNRTILNGDGKLNFRRRSFCVFANRRVVLSQFPTYTVL